MCKKEIECRRYSLKAWATVPELVMTEGLRRKHQVRLDLQAEGKADSAEWEKDAQTANLVS